MALSWKVCSFKRITWDTALRAGQGLPQEELQNSPVGDVRISPSLSCNTEFPSIIFLSMLLLCPVENAWKCGTNAIVSPSPWSKVNWSVLLRLQVTWCWWTNSLIVYCFGASLPQYEALLERALERIDIQIGHIPVRSAVLCSCWAHTRKEGRGDWPTGKENQGHDLRMPWKLLTFKFVCKCARREKEAKEWLYFFLSEPSRDLAMSCCETAILKG